MRKLNSSVWAIMLLATLIPCGEANAQINSGSPFFEIPGDFDSNGIVDSDDIDCLTDDIGESLNFMNFTKDLDGDGAITLSDREILIERFVDTPSGRGTFPGDINLDGVVDVLGDGFQLIENLGTTNGASYSEGDINGDGKVDVLRDAFAFVGNLGSSVPSSKMDVVLAIDISGSWSTANLEFQREALQLFATEYEPTIDGRRLACLLYTSPSPRDS